MEEKEIAKARDIRLFRLPLTGIPKRQRRPERLWRGVGRTSPRGVSLPATILLVAIALALIPCWAHGDQRKTARIGAKAPRVPVIDVTDLYHPHQDVGDNFDLIAPYALPEIDLKAVILDAHDSFRKPISDHPVLSKFYVDKDGPRDPGFIPVMQLNYIFNRDVPVAVGPFTPMRSPDDKMLDIPAFQQQGVELILEILRESREPVYILSFGSARPVAVAYNRDPKLFRAKVKQIHLSAGSSSPEFLEWNVALDQNAIVCLLRSELPIAIYPCGTKEGAFGYGPNNSFWRFVDLMWVKQMDLRLKRYLAYAFGRVARSDFLRAMDEDLPESLTAERYAKPHNVWETAVWTIVANRRLVRPAGGHYRIVPAKEVLPTDKVLPNDLRPCKLSVPDDARFTFEFTQGPSNFLMYDRGDPYENERAFRAALADLYVSFRP